jgi:SAM-dependent methyltransferase
VLYNDSFYKLIKESSMVSSDVIVPLVSDLLGNKIKSVVDFGCGTGVWLKKWQEKGAEKIQGFETGENQNELEILNEKIVRVDLTQLPKNTGSKYDLAMTLEVAEHLPEESAKGFVDSICSYSDVVLFSAAIPGQGGVGHINEKFPSYWNEYFKSNGFNCYDVIRGIIWDNPNVSVWYRQNILLFIKGEIELKKSFSPLDIVHPFFWGIK